MRVAVVADNQREVDLVKQVLSRSYIRQNKNAGLTFDLTYPSRVNVLDSSGQILGYIAMWELEAVINEVIASERTTPKS